MYQHLKTFAKPRGKALERTVTMMLRSMCLRLEGIGFTALGTPYKRGLKVREAMRSCEAAHAACVRWIVLA